MRTDRKPLYTALTSFPARSRCDVVDAPTPLRLRVWLARELELGARPSDCQRAARRSLKGWIWSAIVILALVALVAILWLVFFKPF
jgi:hypothetical protein